MTTHVLVAGHLIVAAEDRTTYLADCVDVVRAARSADGCLDFAISGDCLDPRRINVYERWESQAAVAEYDVAAERSLT